MSKDTPSPFIVVPRPHADSLVYKPWGLETPEGEREALPQDSGLGSGGGRGIGGLDAYATRD